MPKALKEQERDILSRKLTRQDAGYLGRERFLVMDGGQDCRKRFCSGKDSGLTDKPGVPLISTGAAC